VEERARGGKVQIYWKRRSLRHNMFMSDLARDAGKESCAFGADTVLVALRSRFPKVTEFLAFPVSVQGADEEIHRGYAPWR